MGTELYFCDLQRTIIRKNIFSNFFTVKHIFIGKKQPHATRPLYYPSLTPLHLRQGSGGEVNHQTSKPITGTHYQGRVTRHGPVVRRLAGKASSPIYIADYRAARSYFARCTERECTTVLDRTSNRSKARDGTREVQIKKPSGIVHYAATSRLRYQLKVLNKISGVVLLSHKPSRAAGG